ncbi:CBS domain containing-hemolysin-like protein [Neobacillus niacini]|jgi:CBS domain containing-hemolysin-like protein|uniref:hemolysin family protein n=1 Tax=Neobacillus niacini TaxID=86668 RepID=UPI002784FC7B|nr:hemolysin family protein [Neobacillus niacini]MDQ1000238.1 CBS domain containing-hemolysin-like protein [Neobacillus niacini]
MTIINLLLIALLIALTGFFVAIEFAIVKVRPSRIDQLIAEGKKGAVSAKKVVNHLDEYLSACQLGITVTALGLGWLGEPTVEKLIHPLFSVLNINESLSHIISFILAFASVTFLHVVVGELAPKTVAIHKAEEVSLLLAAPIIGFTKVMRPFIWALNGSARVLVGLFGLKPESEQELAHSEEELRLLLSESYKRGEINQNELNYVNNIFEFDERVAKEIMVPRTEISSLSINDSIDVALKKIRREHYSRYPVMEGDKDNIIGILNVKVMVTAQEMNKNHKEEGSLRPFIKPVIKAIETIPIHDLLVRMQKERTQMAILVDEYGGTSGLVTVEDIIEEIVGEVRDEFDNDEVAKIQKVKENHYLLDGKVLIEDVNNLLGTNISGERIDTIGGWFLTQNFDVGIGTEAKFDGYLFKVREAVGHHILYLDVKKIVS